MRAIDFSDPIPFFFARLIAGSCALSDSIPHSSLTTPHNLVTGFISFWIDRLVEESCQVFFITDVVSVHVGYDSTSQPSILQMARSLALPLRVWTNEKILLHCFTGTSLYAWGIRIWPRKSAYRRFFEAEVVSTRTIDLCVVCTRAGWNEIKW